MKCLLVPSRISALVCGRDLVTHLKSARSDSVTRSSVVDYWDIQAFILLGNPPRLLYIKGAVSIIAWMCGLDDAHSPASLHRTAFDLHSSDNSGGELNTGSKFSARTDAPPTAELSVLFDSMFAFTKRAQWFIR